MRQRFSELSGELFGVICLKALVLWGGALDLFRKFFGAVRAIFWLCGFFLALDKGWRESAMCKLGAL